MSEPLRILLIEDCETDAALIVRQLENAGYTTVVQAWDFGPGSNFVLEMHRAARDTRCTIAVLSPAYLNAV